MARPKKSFKNLKLLQINIRVTLEEQIILEEFSKLYGVNVVEYIRIKTLKKQLPKHIMSGINRELLIELSRVGNNINQLTKRANQNNSNLNGLKDDLYNLSESLNQIKKQLLNDSKTN
ncbi:MAG: hypothetical protein A3G95_07690 [Flavobacteria bacterium RIFCSPLOWO2_12_FULL_31_7]|jgi:hypothetical protein|nr:MAG: hypothetical protein A3G95_07690 [Flavobacteria bacterium RIFCSPLOWO2_12_FULL_31_7]